jgi:hypothetical protein
MKRLKKLKELVKAVWYHLNNKEIAIKEKVNDIKIFNTFLNIILKITYFCYGMFSLLSLYFFTTRVIF